MNSPQLTQKVAKKILSIIDQQEANADRSGEAVSSKHYMQLADLYHFEKDFFREAAILKRFARLNSAANDDLVEIYDRIDRASRLSEIKQEIPRNVTTLELVPRADDKDNISLASPRKISRRVNKQLTPFANKSHYVLSVCAAYTGRSDEDEVVQLALVLFKYDASEEVCCEPVDSFLGLRKTKRAVPNKTLMQFGLSQIDRDIQTFDYSKIEKLFERADMVVSHNDADIERKLIGVLFPKLVNKPWYSSQKDIPWGALGYETRGLTQLCKAHGEKAPRSCKERAVGISKLLTKLEPCGEQTYLERLYNMPSMKAFEWTPELKKQSKKLSRNSWLKTAILATATIAISLTVGLGYFYN